MNLIKKNYKIILLMSILILFSIISVFCVYSSKFIVSKTYSNLYIKQIIWYTISFIIFTIILRIKNEKFIKIAYLIYLINIILLILVLFFGVTVNNARSWFKIPFLGNFQPSEFMKFSLILVISKTINDFQFSDKTLKDEIKLIIKSFILTIIPTILVFIEPDTGIVIFYLLIWIFTLFMSGLRVRWFLLLLSILSIIGITFFIIYFNFKELFVSIFGNSFFYRIHRLLDWSNSSGMQLENSMISIGSSGTFGHGLNNTPIYFPEPYTDFIFTIFISNFGFIGGVILILLILIFDILIITSIFTSNNNIDKTIISGIIICLIYAQIQNISMTIGLLPITGIPLPFISYGGSNLIVYIIMLAFIINILKNSKIIKKYN